MIHRSLSRRFFLRTALLCAGDATLALARGPAAENRAALRLRVEHGRPLARVPADFTGLGYEMSSAAQPGLLSAANTAYVQLVRNLGAKGVIRLGGIVSDFTRYVPSGKPRTDPHDTVVNQAALRQLRGFLDAIDWSAIWSLNFGRGTLAEAVVEAKAVAAILGPRLNAVELGNEVENYSRGSKPLRPPPYDFATYRAEYIEWRRAILAAVPGLRFAAPDTAASVEWVERMAASARAGGSPDVQLLTTHYYRGDQRRATLEQLMTPDPELERRLQRLRQASRASGIPWRMCETNSFFGGGHPGLSDTFAAALWTLDYMLRLARSGCAGVNMETGVNQLGFVSSYSPIRYDAQGRATPGAPYYGMLAFAASGAAGGEALEVELDPSPSALSAYAIARGARLHSLVLINRHPSAAAHISLEGPRWPSGRVLRLAAPVLESTEGIRFADAPVDRQGHWSPRSRERVDAGHLLLPPCSAAVVLAGD